MRMTQFIRENKKELTEVISNSLGRVPATASCYCPLSRTEHNHGADNLSERDIRDWIMNEESLYRWARREGVRV